ncbi:MAG: hypothetical protein J0L93_04335 [Deltaproteobacteria bacterium]|nr:hypothetical protein [Deltaproteobacteria bacterium]
MKLVVVLFGLFFSTAVLAVNPLGESMIAYEGILKSAAMSKIYSGDIIKSISNVQSENTYRIQTSFECEILVEVKFNELPPNTLGNRTVKEVSVLEMSKNFRPGTKVSACMQDGE